MLRARFSALSTYDSGIGYRSWTPLTFDALGFVFGVCFGRHFAFIMECTLEGTLLLAFGTGQRTIGLDRLTIHPFPGQIVFVADLGLYFLCYIAFASYGA